MMVPSLLAAQNGPTTIFAHKYPKFLPKSAQKLGVRVKSGENDKPMGSFLCGRASISHLQDITTS